MPETPTTPTGPKRNWKEIVDRHKGTMFFAPTELKEKMQAWQNERLAFSKEANRLAKKEAEIGMLFNALIHDLRKYYEENGLENIWTMDIGFNTEALKDGEFVIDITRPERQP